MAYNTQYRDIVKEFAQACQEHLQIASFNTGPMNYLDAAAVNVQYPFVFLRPLNSKVADNELTRTFDLFVLDVPSTSDGNAIDVMNNTENIVYDLAAWFNKGDKQQTYEMTLSQVVPVQEAFQDRAWGWVGNIDLSTPYIFDYCNYPKV